MFVHFEKSVTNELNLASTLVPPTVWPKTVKPPELLVSSSELALFPKLKKNWLLAELGSDVLAIAMVPAELLMKGAT